MYFVTGLLLALVAIVALGHPLRAMLLRQHVPSPVTLLALGLVLGPSVADLLPDSFLELRGELSKAALVVILLRAGMGVPSDTLRKILVPSLVFGVIPVATECFTLTVVGRWLVFDSYRVSLLAGFLIAAVSPAVVIPAMQNQKDAGIGTANALPDRIMGLTLVNILVAQSGIFTMIELTRYWAPISSALVHVYKFPLVLLAGVALGAFVGRVLPMTPLLGSSHAPEELSTMRRHLAVTMILPMGLLLYFGATALGLESVFAVLAFAVMLRARTDWIEIALRREWVGLWSIAEIVLFVALGSQLDIGQLGQGWIVLTMCAIVVLGVAVRMATTHLMTLRTFLPDRERLHVVVSQVPKATVQAVFGALPLQVFLEAGREPLYHDGAHLLMLSVVAIVLTAPVGAWLIQENGLRLLRDQEARKTA